MSFPDTAASPRAVAAGAHPTRAGSGRLLRQGDRLCASVAWPRAARAVLPGEPHAHGFITPARSLPLSCPRLQRLRSPGSSEQLAAELQQQLDDSTAALETARSTIEEVEQQRNVVMQKLRMSVQEGKETKV